MFLKKGNGVDDLTDETVPGAPAHVDLESGHLMDFVFRLRTWKSRLTGTKDRIRLES